MKSHSTVLIFTYPEHGQANVNLATSYELALAGASVYIASFPSLGPRIAHLQALIDRHASCSEGGATGSVTFCECKGITEPWRAQEKYGVDDASLPHPHGVSGALQGYSKLGAVLFPWTPDEYHACVERCREIITAIKADVVVVDTIFYAAVDACKLANQKYIGIFPSGIKEVAAHLQPCLAVLWKYPVVSSGFPFPLKWWQIPLNIYLLVRFTILLMTSLNIAQIQALRGFSGLQNLFGVRPGVKYISPALTETDFQFAFVPKNIQLCGPIISPFDPLEESDPALMKWLDNGPTVLINFGSHVMCDEHVAREMANAFLILFAHHDQRRPGSRTIQVLWKAKADVGAQKVIDDLIGSEVSAGRVKVVSWLNAEPVSILQHPNVVCTVHHGGANSFYEGVWSGVPHVVLPVWYDTYDYARRAEFLNIGIFGSKTSAPGVCAEEFGEALVRVTGDGDEAVKLSASAKRLKEVCRAKGNGRKIAAMAILEVASSSCDTHGGDLEGAKIG